MSVDDSRQQQVCTGPVFTDTNLVNYIAADLRRDLSSHHRSRQYIDAHINNEDIGLFVDRLSC